MYYQQNNLFDLYKQQVSQYHYNMMQTHKKVLFCVVTKLSKYLGGWVWADWIQGCTSKTLVPEVFKFPISYSALNVEHILWTGRLHRCPPMLLLFTQPYQHQTLKALEMPVLSVYYIYTPRRGWGVTGGYLYNLYIYIGVWAENSNNW